MNLYTASKERRRQAYRTTLLPCYDMRPDLITARLRYCFTSNTTMGDGTPDGKLPQVTKNVSLSQK